jgi:integrase
VNTTRAPARASFPGKAPAGVSIYKPKGATERTRWHIAYRLHKGAKRIVERVSTDPKIVQRRALEVAQLVQQGQADPVVARRQLMQKRPLEEHLSDYHKTLLARNTTTRHAGQVVARVRRVLSASGARYISDLVPSTIQVAIADLRDQRVDGAGDTPGAGGRCPTCRRSHARSVKGLCGRCQKRQSEGRPLDKASFEGAPISLRTRNHHLRAMKQFTAWLAGPERRAKEDPLKHLRAWNVDTDLRHLRQDLGEHGAAKLIMAVRHSDAAYGMAGEDRAMLYETALETGFRAEELRTLANSPQVFRLNSEHPLIVVRAAYSKHRREDHQPVRREFAERLRDYLAGKPSNAQVWPLPAEPVDMLRVDLALAGIPYVDADGRYADFHSLRHTFVCRLVRAGVHPKECQKLARHSSITLTMDYYAHLSLQDASCAINKLGNLGSPGAN